MSIIEKGGLYAPKYSPFAMADKKHFSPAIIFSEEKIISMFEKSILLSERFIVLDKIIFSVAVNKTYTNILINNKIYFLCVKYIKDKCYKLC